MYKRVFSLYGSIILVILCAGTVFGQAADVACVDGSAAGFSCNNIDLVSWLTVDQLGGNVANGVLNSDLWGWQSPTTQKEYVLVGQRNGTAIVDVSDPAAPITIGRIPSQQSGLSDYRDIKVYADHAYIIGDIPYTAHGMQVFDLTQLDTVTQTTTFTATAVYDEIGFGHNMWINEATGLGMIFRSDTCESGEHMVDLTDPANPTFAGCSTVNGGSSDAECVIYTGVDTDYQGREICFVGSDDTAGISDVTDRANPIEVADFVYPNIARAHQGVLTADQSYWLISDTMDEMMHGLETSTVVIDVRDLDNPQYVRTVSHGTTARDHNIYLLPQYENVIGMTNWRAGLRITDISDFENWQELGYFDTYPADDGVAMKSGSWSHYDHLSSGVIAVSDVESGLFLLRPDIDAEATAVQLTTQHFSVHDLGWIALVATVLLTPTIVLNTLKR